MNPKLFFNFFGENFSSFILAQAHGITSQVFINWANLAGQLNFIQMAGSWCFFTDELVQTLYFLFNPKNNRFDLGAIIQ